MNLLPGTISAKTSVVVMHCWPWRKVVRQHPPRASGSHQVQNTVDNLSQVSSSRSPTGFRCWQQRFDQLPLFIHQITGVYFNIHTSVIGQNLTFHTLSYKCALPGDYTQYQFGFNNEAHIIIDGDNNQTRQWQSGSGNFAKAEITGDNNTTTQKQIGINNSSIIKITGSYNKVCNCQEGIGLKSPTKLKFTGDYRTINVSQFGIGH